MSYAKKEALLAKTDEEETCKTYKRGSKTQTCGLCKHLMEGRE